MKNPDKSKVLESRLLDLSVETIKILQADKALPTPVKDQLTRSITSIGANYMEANNAISKADFRSKVYIAKKEIAESIYWVAVIRRLSNDSASFAHVYDELNQLIRLFQKIVSTLNNNPTNEK